MDERLREDVPRDTRTAKSCGPDAPTLASRSRWVEKPLRPTVARKPGHRGEREGNRKAIAQGVPVETGEPVEDYRILVRPRVHRTPGIPCALLLRGRTKLQTSDAARRENDDSYSVV